MCPRVNRQTTLRRPIELGGADDMDVIGYRNPFVFIGAKGLENGKAQMLLDKRSQSKTVSFI